MWSQRFHDALKLYKGPSLGTNFSLLCPYTLLAHYFDLDWAESFGVSRNLLRLSVGLESFEVKEWILAQSDSFFIIYIWSLCTCLEPPGSLRWSSQCSDD